MPCVQALLFKELNKRSAGHRANELFEWLRRLDDVSVLVSHEVHLVSSCRCHASFSV